VSSRKDARRDIDLSVYLGLGVDAFAGRFSSLFECAAGLDRATTSAADWLAGVIAAQCADTPRWTACPVIPEVLSQHSGPVVILEDLLEQPDHLFLSQVFETLLGRSPDPAGLRHYDWALREGRFSREEVIGDICRSREYAERNIALITLAELRHQVENAGRLLLVEGDMCPSV
jgi:hypothetical protein